MSTQTPEPQYISLGRELERVRRKVDLVDGLLRELSESVSAMSAQADKVKVRSWLEETDSQQAAGDLEDLVIWLGAVYLRYQGAALPDCWLWHQDVVAELLWLRHAHLDAYHGPDASWQRVADWHERYRPGVVSRIKSCAIQAHEPDGQQYKPAKTIPNAEARLPLAQHHTSIHRDQVAPSPTDLKIQISQYQQTQDRTDSPQNRKHT